MKHLYSQTDTPKVEYYDSLEQDFVQARDPDFQLPEHYCWTCDKPGQRLGYHFWHGLFALWTRWYCGAWHGITVEHPEILPESGTPGFLFLNHTQPVIDPFLPHWILKPRRFCSICAPSNFSIPFLGRLLPLLGAIPTPSTVSGLKQMKEALNRAIDRKEWIVIYPEAHVWPWCTWIRPFPDTSFQFVLDTQLPAYCGVLTYQPRTSASNHRHALRRDDCDLVVRLAGPFYPDPQLPRRKARRQLRDEVQKAMMDLARASTCEKIRYLPRENEQEQP